MPDMWKVDRPDGFNNRKQRTQKREDKPEPGTKRAKQAAKAERTSAREKAREDTTAKKRKHITQMLLDVEAVEVGYVYHGPKVFEIPVFTFKSWRLCGT
jgi:hypothetical protein